MKYEIKVPAMGESIAEATIGSILKPTGSQVSMDDEILELETDKVNQAIYAPQAGILTLSVKPEQVVKIGAVIGYIDTEGVAKEAKAEEKAVEAEPEEKMPPEKPREEKPLPSPAAPVSGKSRVTREDFLAETLKPAPLKPKPIAAPKAPAEKGESRRKMTKIRKVIAERLVEVKAKTAMLTTFNEVDLTEVIAIRERHKESFIKEHGVKLGFMSFFVKAVVSALQAFPDLNSYIDGDEIVTRRYYDIGIAVGTERGLIVPVVRGCDNLSFAGIEKAIDEFSKKAKTGGLTVDDLQGGGFTITNGGVYGSMMSTPILNPNQSGILGMHKIMRRPVAMNDQVAIRPMMYLAMSYDHRIIDGKEAVSFLIHIKEFLEDPARLLLEG